jgi:hypothetical protein
MGDCISSDLISPDFYLIYHLPLFGFPAPITEEHKDMLTQFINYLEGVHYPQYLSAFNLTYMRLPCINVVLLNYLYKTLAKDNQLKCLLSGGNPWQFKQSDALCNYIVSSWRPLLEAGHLPDD